MKQLINVLPFIRRDGPISAPLVFLSIEDGGDDFTSLDQFRKWILGDDVWEPRTRNKMKLGKPGEIIPKIILSASRSSLDGWQKYRDEVLYLSNECHIKFYPIGRGKVSTWKGFFTEATGLTHGEYMALCQRERPQIIWDRYGSLLQSVNVKIVVGAINEWSDFFDTYSEPAANNRDDETKRRGHSKWGLILRDDGNLHYAYLNMFARGLSSNDILSFGEALRAYLPQDVLDHLSNEVAKVTATDH